MSDVGSSGSSPAAAPAIAESMFSRRRRKQLSIFFAGATITLFSAVITRRSILSRNLAARPHFYQPSNAPTRAANGAADAFEALSIATMQVMGITTMMGGGFIYAFDIKTIDDLRRKIRGGLGVDGTGRTEKEAEEEFEEWLATTLERKRLKDEAKREMGEKVNRAWKNERGKER